MMHKRDFGNLESIMSIISRLLRYNNSIAYSDEGLTALGFALIF